MTFHDRPYRPFFRSRFSTKCAVLFVATIMCFGQRAMAQLDTAPYDITQSPGWTACKPDVMTLENIYKAIPCVAKTDMAGAKRFLDYEYSIPVLMARKRLAQQQSHGDGMAEARLLGTWSGALNSAQSQVRLMELDANRQRTVATIVNVPNAPVRLTSCAEMHALESPQWEISASWVATKAPLTAVKVRVETQNAFGDTLQTDDLTPTGQFAVNVPASDAWTVGEAHMPASANIKRVRCSAIAAIFSDGTMWTAPTKQKPPIKK